MKLNSRILSQLARNPRLLAEFNATGKVPGSLSEQLQSPLITLLDSIYPHERCLILGVKVGPALGYTHSRQFHTAGQALNWVKPANTHNAPARSYQIREFRKQLTIDDLAECCANCPKRVIDGWWKRHSHLSHLRKSESKS